MHICACFANQMPLEKRGNYAQYVLLLEEEKLREQRTVRNFGDQVSTISEVIYHDYLSA